MTRLSGLCLIACLVAPGPVYAWGREGHQIVALVAKHYLQPAVRTRVKTILAGDDSRLTKHDMLGASVWADKWRHAGGDLDGHGHHRTSRWHYINLELHDPDMNYACWGHKGLHWGQTAFQGTWKSCITDKIDQFDKELASADTSKHERLLALKFVIHLVGDLHQPLHASDNHDYGGNDVRVSGLTRHLTNLHHAWDTLFVRDLGRKPKPVANALIAQITPEDIKHWQRGTPEDWAWESYRMAKRDAYGRLPGSGSVHAIDKSYRHMADNDVALQLSKGGVRLAWLLNRAL